MTDKKISELDAITGSNTAATDVFVVVDTSTGQTKKITREELNNAIEQDVLSSIDIDTINGDFSVNGNINLGDDDKAIFGAGSDLQIYHDGANSFIRDNGSGNLSLSTNGSKIGFYDQANNQFLAEAFTGAGFRLYYDGSQKFVTQPNGIDVTGTVTADGLTVDGPSVDMVTLNHSTPTDTVTIGQDSSGDFRIRNGGTNRLKSFANGDFELYEDTGTTAKLFWDASAESLELSGNGLDISEDTGNSQIRVVTGSGDAGIELNAGNSQPWYIYNSTNDLHIRSDDTDYLTIDTSGNVNINGTNNRPLAITSFDTVSAGAGWDLDATSGNGVVTMSTGGTERLRIDSSGNLLVGKTSTSSALTTAGVDLRPEGRSFMARSGGPSLYLSRTTSDGNIVEFYKDGTTVGSIGTTGNRMYAGTGDTGLFFNDQLDSIDPWNTSTNAARDNAIDLGDSTRRFKDLYLGGTAYVGTSVAANTSDGSDTSRLSIGGGGDANSTGRGSLVQYHGNEHASVAGAMRHFMGNASGSYISWHLGSGTEAMRIDSSGNVLVGKTSATVSNDGFTATAGGYVTITDSSFQPLILNRKTSDGTILELRKDNTTVGSIGTVAGDIVIGTGTAGLRFWDSGPAIQPRNSDGSANNDAIDLGISTSRFKDLHLSGTANAVTINTDGPTGTGNGIVMAASGWSYKGRIGMNGTSGGKQYWTANYNLNTSSVDNALLYSTYIENSAQNGIIAFGTSSAVNTAPSERARLDASGNLLVGTTGIPNGTSVYGFGVVDGGGSNLKQVRIASSTTTSVSVARFYNSNGNVGSIQTSGSSTSYVTSSDYRLKENVTGITGGIERVKQLNPSRFNFIADADTTVDGFLAHEAAMVVPEAVTGEKDAVDEDGNPDYQGIDQAKLVPLLTAALQEAITKIEDLEARVATLEGN